MSTECLSSELKAGDTSEVRHDAVYVELPKGRKLIVVVLTCAGDVKPLLPAIARHLREAYFDYRVIPGK